MYFDRVIGWTMLYAVIARNEYENISSAVEVSPSRSVTMRLAKRPKKLVIGWQDAVQPRRLILCHGPPRGNDLVGIPRCTRRRPAVESEELDIPGERCSE